MPTEIKVICPACKKEIKVLLHMVDKLQSENQSLRKLVQQLKSNKQKTDFDMPDFMRDLLK